eukprot:171206_1
MFQMFQNGQGAMPRQTYRMSNEGFTQNVDAYLEEQKYGVDLKQWRCVYPCYLNVKKTIAEGRKISKSYCIQQPHPNDIADACNQLGLPCYIEMNKKHPRDFFTGSRVRVLLKDKDDNFMREDIKNRYQLLIALGGIIPNLESRKIRLEEQEIKAKEAMLKLQKEKPKAKKPKQKKPKKQWGGNSKVRGDKGGRRGKGGRRDNKGRQRKR